MMRVCLLLLCVSLLIACEKKETAAPEAADTSLQAIGVEKVDHALQASEGERVLTFNVEGMTCNNCVGTIQTAAAGVPGVKKVGVSLEDAKAWVLTDDDSTVTAEAITAAIKATSYDATPVTP